jgi:hypothetical protein
MFNGRPAAPSSGRRLLKRGRKGHEKADIVDWTSTQMNDWQVHCENLMRKGEDFEVRDVAEPEHRQVVQVMAVRHHCAFSTDGSTVRFRPRPGNAAPAS